MGLDAGAPNRNVFENKFGHRVAEDVTMANDEEEGVHACTTTGLVNKDQTGGARTGHRGKSKLLQAHPLGCDN